MKDRLSQLAVNRVPIQLYDSDVGNDGWDAGEVLCACSDFLLMSYYQQSGAFEGYLLIRYDQIRRVIYGDKNLSRFTNALAGSCFTTDDIINDSAYFNDVLRALCQAAPRCMFQFTDFKYWEGRVSECFEQAIEITLLDNQGRPEGICLVNYENISAIIVSLAHKGTYSSFACDIRFMSDLE